MDQLPIVISVLLLFVTVLLCLGQFILVDHFLARKEYGWKKTTHVAWIAILTTLLLSWETGWWLADNGFDRYYIALLVIFTVSLLLSIGHGCLAPKK